MSGQKQIVTAAIILLVALGTVCNGQKNVLILFPEDMGNHMGSLGTPGIETPVMDALAEQGVQFTANFCGQPAWATNSMLR